MKALPLGILLLVLVFATPVRAQRNAILVTEFGQSGIEDPAYADLALYDWPNLGVPTRRSDIPEHHALALSLDGRELFLFAHTKVRVLDRVTLQTRRVMTVESAPTSFAWAWKATISPFHPEVVMMGGGYWFNITTGQFTQTPSTLAPGYTILDGAMDDAGRYFTVSLARSMTGGGTEYRLRVINLDGTDVAQRDIANAARGVVLSRGRVAISRKGMTSAVEVLDLATLAPLSSLHHPTAYLTALSGDGRGGVVAVTEQIPGNQSLLHWPEGQTQPIVVKADGESGDRSSLRVQNGKVLLLQQAYTLCSLICLLGPSNITVFDPAQGTTQSIASESSPYIADAALLPLGQLPSPIPSLAPVAAVLLALMMIVVSWRFQRVRARGS